MSVETIKTILAADSSQFQSEFNKARSTIDNYQKHLLGAAAAIGGSALLAGAVAKFNELRNSIDRVNDGAARLEIPVEDFQRLEAVATMSGSSVEALSKALNKSKLMAVDAAGGSESLAKEFAKLGINASEFLTLSPTERLVALSQGFNSAKDQAGAFKAVFALLGKGAGELIPLLRDGEAGIAAISSRLQVLGGEDVAAVARMNDEIDLLSSNLKTQMGGALLAIRPQIEEFVKLLAGAAEGLAVLADPAGGVGKQGGEFGGAAMLRDIDKFSARIDEIKAKQASGDTWSLTQGPAGLSNELENSVEAVDTLKARYAGLSAEAKIYAEQLREFERARESGMGEPQLKAALDVIQETTAGKLRALEAEKQLVIESANVAKNFERQQEEAEKLGPKIEALRTKLSQQMGADQPSTVRSDLARMDMEGLLAGNKASGTEDLMSKADANGDPTARYKQLQDLEQILKLKEEIKKADAETASGETKQAEQFDALQTAIKEAAAASSAAMEAGQALVDQAKADPAQTAARADLAAEMQALDLRRSGQTAMAKALTEENALRKEAAALAKSINATEDAALKTLRDKKQLAEEIRLLAGGLSARTADRQAKRDEMRQTKVEDSRLRNRKGENERAEQVRKNALEEQKKGKDNQKPEEVKEFWQKHLNLQEKLVNHFEKLGCV